MELTSPHSRNRFSYHRLLSPAIVAILTLLVLPGLVRRSGADPLQVGTLQSDPKRAPQLREAGFSLATVGLAWTRFEPHPSEVDENYVQEIRARLGLFKAAKQEVVLDFGFQYPPTWVLEMPNSRYVNQYGTPYVETASGKNVANAVFNGEVRRQQDEYVALVFQKLGTDFKAVRLGWGWYGELHYPKNTFGADKNCYWGYDDLAQGKTTGLPAGIAPCPVASWKPGDPDPDKTAARQFINWYFDALQNYQNWQIQTVRRHYKGWLTVLYPSWGLRPGQADAAMAAGLSGETPAERGGDMAEAVDYARLVGSICDKDTVLHTTWIDPKWGKDGLENPNDWTPVHYLRVLADTNPLHLKVSGENTGAADQAALERTFDRARREHLEFVLWAFESQLFDSRFVSFDAFVAALKQKPTE